MNAELGQLFSSSYTYIYLAKYISGDRWWLDSDGKNWWSRKTRFNYDVIYLPEVGEFDLKINGVWYKIAPGKLVYITAGSDVEFRYDGDGPLEKHYIHFDLLFGERPITSYFRFPHVIDITDPAPYRVAFREIYGASEDSLSQSIRANGMLLSLVAGYLEQSCAEYIYDSTYSCDAIKAAARYMAENYNANISASDLAERCGYSATYFAKKFKKNFGCTPTEFLYNIKISHAKKMLKTTNASIVDIGAALGFCDASHFSNFFKAKTGVFPTYYRKFENG